MWSIIKAGLSAGIRVAALFGAVWAVADYGAKSTLKPIPPNKFNVGEAIKLKAPPHLSGFVTNVWRSGDLYRYQLQVALNKGDGKIWYNKMEVMEHEIMGA